MRRKLTILGTVGAALALTAVALAYFLGTGSGTANAKSGSSPVAVDVSVDASAAQALYPGDAAVNVPVTISKQAGGHPAHISAVHLTVGTPTGGTGTCLASWFLVTDPANTVANFPNGTNVNTGNPLTVNGTIQYDPAFDNTDESGCSGATIPITATAS